MKVAVSIPDPVFAEAETLAKRLNTSRSDIYARALRAFIGDHDGDRVMRSINDVVDAVGETSDDFTREAARRALARVEW